MICFISLGFFLIAVEYKNKRQSTFLNPQHFAWINICSLKTLLSLATAKKASESSYCTDVSINFNNKAAVKFSTIIFSNKNKITALH